MVTLVFFLEEPSARAMLESFLPKFLPENYETKYIVFEGKSDLERRLLNKLQGWNKPDSHFIVLRDQDSADCKEIKDNLKRKCQEAHHPETLVRIACHELENWYLGDLEAVEIGLNQNGLSKLQNKKKFREPDSISNAVEELRKITKKKYQKISGSREIGKYMDRSRNNSHSFNVFLQGLENLLQNDQI